MKFIATPEQLRARLELRRSNASAKHVNKKKYNRKKKHVGKSIQDFTHFCKTCLKQQHYTTLQSSTQPYTKKATTF